MGEDEEARSLKDFDARLRKARAAHEPEVDDGPPGNNMALALRVAIEMVAALVVGGVIGWFLDRWLDTRPWLLLAFLLLGVAAGILNAYRTAMRLGAGGKDGDSEHEGGSPRD